MGNLLVYKASAGSGKTYNLALEYIKLALLDKSDTAYRNILAVTFTNKATGEMKTRILVQLFNLAYGGLDPQFLDNLLEKLNTDAPTDDKGDPIRFTKGEVFRRAKNLLANIIHDYDHFRVETIDSFFQSLLTNLAHELNLPRSFRVDLNDKDVVARAVERLMSELQDRRSAARKKGVMKQVIDYMNEQIEDEKGWNMVSDLQKFAQSNLFNNEYRAHEEALSKALANNKDIFSQLRQFIKTEEPRFRQQVTDAAQKAINYIESLVGGTKRLSNLGKIQTNLAKICAEGPNTEIGAYAAKGIKNPETLIKKSDLKKDDVRKDALEMSRHLVALEEAFTDYTSAIETARITISHAGPIRLLGQIEQKIKEINDETGHVMLADTPELFSRVVQSDDAPFVFERVGTTFRHIMIDEFQDTSKIQWENFRKLLVENMSAGNQCMLVGDIKQSIYRWRGGDWEILDNVGKELRAFNQKQVPLKINWRSKHNIVHFNNLLFQKCAPILDHLIDEGNPLYPDNKDRINSIYHDVEQEDRSQGGWIRMAFSSSQTTQEEIFEDVYQQITMLNKEANVNYGDMGVLVRYNHEGVALINYLTEHHPEIPINSDEAFSLTSSRSVMILVHALHYLADRSDLLSLTQLLLGVIAQKQEEEGVEPTAGKIYPEEIQEMVKNPEQHLPAALFDEALLHLPLYELCQCLISEFHLTSSADSEEKGGQSAYLFSFLDAVLDFLADNPSDLQLFVNHWDNTLQKASTTGDHNDCIYVMSVHKSKGLARHTILIPFCDWELEKFRRDDILWCPTPNCPPFNALPVTAISPYNANIDHSVYCVEKEQEKLQKRIDNLNMLYVAFTRAESNLLVWSRAIKTSQKDKDAIKTVGHLLLQATEAPDIKNLFTLQPSVPLPAAPTSEEDEEEEESEESPFTVSTIGQPEASKQKAKEENTAENGSDKLTIINPLDKPHIDKIITRLDMPGVMGSLAREGAKVEFRQSNPAKDYIADNATLPLDPDHQLLAEEAQKTRHYIDRGKVLHRIFQFIETIDDLPKAIAQLSTEGILGDTDYIRKQIERIKRAFTKPEVVQWFDGSWTLFNECEILWRDDKGELHSKRPDRVMVRQDETIVIDFKFSNPEEKHIDQVREYMSLMRQMGRTNVKGYVWYVMRDKVKDA